MNNIITYILIGLATTSVSFFITTFVTKNKKFIDLNKKQEEAEILIKESKHEAEKVLKETTLRTEKTKTTLNEETLRREERIKKIRQSLEHKEETTLKREEKIKEIKLKIVSFQEETQSKKEATKRTEQEIKEKLSLKTGETLLSLKEKILKNYKKELEEDEKKKLSSIVEVLKEDAPKQARKTLLTAIQRLCSPTSVETRIVLIKVPKDSIKGKIVGKDGKNILELEKKLDVAMVFNDLPNTISISAYNLVTRRIAEKTIEQLIKIKGGIDEKVIEKTVILAEKETDEELYEIGKKALEKMGLKNQNKDFIRTIGRLQYRTSYGQNIMKHSMEVAWIAIMIGSEIGLNIETCKTGGFLHDLGKAIDQDPDIKDAHDRLTKELMEKYNFSPNEVHAAWAHHDAIPQETPEALIVKAADAVSGGRPGARQDTIEKYIERIQAIDETINSFNGVKKSYIMSAGREVRIYVNPEKITDEQVSEMAKNIAQKVEDNVTYPGKIKIKVIRRTKSMEIAK